MVGLHGFAVSADGDFDERHHGDGYRRAGLRWFAACGSCRLTAAGPEQFGVAIDARRIRGEQEREANSDQGTEEEYLADGRSATPRDQE